MPDGTGWKHSAHDYRATLPCCDPSSVGRSLESCLIASQELSWIEGGGDTIDNGLVSQRRTTRRGAVDSEIGARNAFALLGISDLPIRAFVAK